MAKPYSQDLRDRVIGAVDSGMSARAASRLFGISESTGIKWVARWRRTGSIGAKRMGGYKRSPRPIDHCSRAARHAAPTA